MTSPVRTVHVRITGRVQGVGYRVWTEREAGERRLTGWVRNRYDDTVEAVFQGADAAVDAMLAACATGPRSARVDRVEVLPDDEDDAAYERFEVRPTV